MINSRSKLLNSKDQSVLLLVERKIMISVLDDKNRDCSDEVALEDDQ